MKLTLDEYQKLAAEYDRAPKMESYYALGLGGETGEVLEKLKKHHRDGLEVMETRNALEKELGDVLWYVAVLARQWGLTLNDIANANIAKLESRRQRGVLHGQGDNR